MVRCARDSRLSKLVSSQPDEVRVQVRVQVQVACMSGRVEVTTVPKPWGHETIWAKTDRYVGKILHIRAGQALSLQYHRTQDETIRVLSATLRLEIGREGEPSRRV